MMYLFLSGPDQAFLKKYVWPWAKLDAMQHDSYFCKNILEPEHFLPGEKMKQIISWLQLLAKNSTFGKNVQKNADQWNIQIGNIVRYMRISQIAVQGYCLDEV